MFDKTDGQRPKLMVLSQLEEKDIMSIKEYEKLFTRLKKLDENQTEDNKMYYDQFVLEFIGGKPLFFNYLLENMDKNDEEFKEIVFKAVGTNITQAKSRIDSTLEDSSDKNRVEELFKKFQESDSVTLKKKVSLPPNHCFRIYPNEGETKYVPVSNSVGILLKYSTSFPINLNLHDLIKVSNFKERMKARNHSSKSRNIRK